MNCKYKRLSYIGIGINDHSYGLYGTIVGADDATQRVEFTPSNEFPDMSETVGYKLKMYFYKVERGRDYFPEDLSKVDEKDVIHCDLAALMIGDKLESLYIKESGQEDYINLTHSANPSKKLALMITRGELGNFTIEDDYYISNIGLEKIELYVRASIRNCEENRAMKERNHGG